MNNPSKEVMMISGKNDERIATQQKPDQALCGYSNQLSPLKRFAILSLKIFNPPSEI
jgi:hypothetical protein